MDKNITSKFNCRLLIISISEEDCFCMLSYAMIISLSDNKLLQCMTILLVRRLHTKVDTVHVTSVLHFRLVYSNYISSTIY